MKTSRIQNYIVTGILFLGTLAGAGTITIDGGS